MRWVAVVVLGTLLGACGDDGGSDPGDGSVGGEVTYYRDVLPLIQRECLSCHVEGGIGPFPLDGYEAVVDQSDAVVSAVYSGYMPPWMPDPSCGSFAHERGLDPAERQVFVDWNAAGLPMGDPADAPPPPEDPVVDFSPTDSSRIEGGYVPDVTRPDDYRCFLLDQTVEETRYLTGSWVQPDQADMVHHVLVYAVGPDQVAEVEAADGADGQVGYTCFGGPIPGGRGVPPTQLGAWVPGLLPDSLPAGRGIRVEAGSRIVMQVHYNTTAQASPAADETEFQMRLQDAEPEVPVQTMPLPILELDIPAGENDAVHTETFRNWTDRPMTIVSMTPHMHLLGTRFRARFVGAAGTEPVCLLDIPEWDFQWQQGYARPQSDPVVLQPGEGIEVQCAYDNSATNQPVVNGVQRDPVDVEWGEGTLDEMCILYIRREVPLAEVTPPAVATCEGLADCRAECGASLECLYSCEALNSVDRECQNCATTQAVQCVQALNDVPAGETRDPAHCGTEWFFLGDCLRQCIVHTNLLGGSTDACLRAECGSQYESMLTCTDALFASGECDSYLSTCDPDLPSSGL
ncbi:MAG: hypothetical protein CMN30_26255 [Sandaracinus sp.]|nr:hypothetical protein [Sandaracinus sp.]